MLGYVLAGPKNPRWSCSCGMDGNWASRVVCRECGKLAPQRIANAARAAESEVEVEEAVPSPRVTIWPSSNGSCWPRLGLRSWVPVRLRQDQRRGGVRQWSQTTAAALAARGGSVWVRRSRSFGRCWGQTMSRSRSGVPSWRTSTATTVAHEGPGQAASHREGFQESRVAIERVG